MQHSWSRGTAQPQELWHRESQVPSVCFMASNTQPGSLRAVPCMSLLGSVAVAAFMQFIRWVIKASQRD